jgi:hypothetical protein
MLSHFFTSGIGDDNKSVGCGFDSVETMDLRAVQQAMEQLKAAKEEIAKMQAKRDVAVKSVMEAKLAVQAAEKQVMYGITAVDD